MVQLDENEGSLICINHDLKDTFDNITKSWCDGEDFISKCEGSHNVAERNKVKAAKYLIKSHFECSHCKNSWTSMRGLIEVKVAKSAKYKYFDICVYNQQCNKCDRWSDDFHVYEEDRRPLVDFCLALLQGIETNNKERKSGLKKKKIHDRQRCFACMQGIKH